VAFDKSSNMFTADTGNNVIRKAAGDTQIITTFAGNGYIGGSPGDGGPPGAATLP
jgi:hypothetical protein